MNNDFINLPLLRKIIKSEIKPRLNVQIEKIKKKFILNAPLVKYMKPEHQKCFYRFSKRKIYNDLWR